MSSIPVDAVAAPAHTSPMEPRIAALEAHAEHFDRDLRELRSKLDKVFLILATMNIASTLALAGLIAKGFHWL